MAWEFYGIILTLFVIITIEKIIKEVIYSYCSNYTQLYELLKINFERTSQTLYLSGQPILKINKQNQAIYTIQQPTKIHLRSP